MFGRVVVDLGAGDGKYALRRALCDPLTFALAVDASADGLVTSAWKARRARLTNIAFLVEAVERLPRGLGGIADEVTIQFPWGSLLKGVLDVDPRFVGPVASLVRRGGEVRMLISATPRDGYADLRCADLVNAAAGYGAYGLSLREARTAAPLDLQASDSSWAKRLGADRVVIVARFRKR